MAETQTAPETSANEAKPAKGGLAGKLMIAGFLGVVVALECMLAYFLIPDAEEVAALAEERMAQRLPATMSDDDMTDKDSASTVEVDLGEYSVTVTPANSSTTLRVDFHLYGTVLEEEANDVAGLYDRHVHRFRDQILYEIRNSEPVDLADPGLGLIKRRILEKSNALFGKPVLRSVVFSQFSYIEQ